MNSLDWLINWLINMNIDWEKAVVTWLAAFLGAWFAYRFNLRQQKKWDDERRIEEEQRNQANQITQLNYLKTYLITSLHQFVSIYAILKKKQKQYNDIVLRGYTISENEEGPLRQIIVDLSYQMTSNANLLMFTMGFPIFLAQLASVETNIKRFQSQIGFFNSRVKDSVWNYQLTRNMKELVDSQKENIQPVFHLLYASVDSIDVMLGILEKYVNKQGLILNFNKEAPSKEMLALVELSKKEMKAFYEQKKS